MTKDLLVVCIISTIVEDPDTIPMGVQHPTREEKILQKEEAKDHHQEREEVKMIVMNEDTHGEARIRKGEKIIKELYKTKTSSSCW